MRRPILAALVAILMTSTPVLAQLFPAPAANPTTQQPAELVLVDATLYVNPPTNEGLCMGISPGQVTVTVKRVTEAVEQPRPARFGLYGFMVDPDTRIEIPISNQEVSTTTRVNGSNRYCWNVSIEAPETQGMSMAQRGAYVQTVAVRIVHRPE